MDELVQRIVTNIGLDQAKAERSVGLILGFLQAEGPAGKVGEFTNLGGFIFLGYRGKPLFLHKRVMLYFLSFIFDFYYCNPF